MRVLYVDISLRGHRLNYLKALVENNNDTIALLPESSDEIHCKQIVMTSGYDKKRDLFSYVRWIKEIIRIAKNEEVSLIHILCGDALYRFFGLLMFHIQIPVVITYHHMQFGRLRNISLKRIFKNSSGIVHTNHLKELLNSIGINNVTQIEYPVFLEEVASSKQDARMTIGLKQDIRCLLTLGGTQHYKGVDILLEALRMVKEPFQLYMTGVIRDYSLESIMEKIAPFSQNVILNMNRLSDTEYQNAIAAADILVLPYRREFDGASGPMIEAVWNRKYIVGAAHGSMGRIIKENELGRTFSTESPEDLARTLDYALTCNQNWSTKAELFRESLTVDKFLERNHKIYLEVMKS